MIRQPHRRASAAAVFVSMAVLAGCSSGSSGSATAPGATGAGTSSTPAAGGGYGVSRPSATSSAAAASTSSTGSAVPGIAVTAIEKEFSIALSRRVFAPGRYTFTVHNEGSYSHNLTIEGPGVDRQASPTVPGGSTGTVSVTLSKGSYEIWCSVDSHKDKGMDMTITVG